MGQWISTSPVQNRRYQNRTLAGHDYELAMVEAAYCDFRGCSFTNCTLILSECVFTDCKFEGVNYAPNPQNTSFNDCTGQVRLTGRP